MATWPAYPNRFPRKSAPVGQHKAEEPILGHWIYTLGYPNHEVESSLNASLLSVYTDDPSRSFAHRLRLLDLLLAHDLAGLKDLFQAFFATIPYQ